MLQGRPVTRDAMRLRATAGLLLLTAAAGSAEAATRRALLVAIDKYRPVAAKPAETSPASAPNEQVVSASPARRTAASRGTWTDLDGAVNDAVAFRELLVARAGFRPEDIVLLTNAEATRDGILTAFRKHLIDGSQRGDVVLFLYAGHGSRVRNSLTDEPDGMDETIVPADSSRGAPDIRDKELNRLFVQVLDKGASLTVVADSCHSGSIARGVPRPEKTRYLPPDERDVKEAPDGTPSAEERGALVFSAAQDSQLAGETSDEEGNSHGAFSLALLKTLQTVSAYETAQDVFLKVKALMQSEGRSQEPVLAGPPERRQRGLFANGGGGLGRTRVAVLRKTRAGHVALQGGLAVGLREGAELKAVSGVPGGLQVRLKVVRVNGVASAEAEVIAGAPDAVSPGDLFEVDRWVVGDSPLRVSWPASLPSRADLQRMLDRLSPLARAPEITWIDDPTATSPSHVVEWDGSAWRLTGPTDAVPLGLSPSVADVTKRLRNASERPRIFVRVPPDNELVAALQLGAGSGNDGIEVAANPTDAHYLLVGRLAGGGAEYAWVIPNSTQEDTSDGAFALPLRTDWIKEPPRLEEQVLGLRRLRSWLQLAAPAHPGLFPYRLALKNAETGKTRTAGVVTDGEGYGLVLQARPEDVERGVECRYVYVFALDSYGNSTLLFPRASDGNVENRVPYESSGAGGFPAEIPLGKARLFTVGPPYGVDTYVLLSTAEPIPDPSVLSFSGVRTRGSDGNGSSSNPLSRLLSHLGSSTRGVSAEAPADWSIERLSLRSVGGGG
jgi:hypothetical protein